MKETNEESFDFKKLTKEQQEEFKKQLGEYYDTFAKMKETNEKSFDFKKLTKVQQEDLKKWQGEYYELFAKMLKNVYEMRKGYNEVKNKVNNILESLESPAEREEIEKKCAELEKAVKEGEAFFEERGYALHFEGEDESLVEERVRNASINLAVNDPHIAELYKEAMLEAQKELQSCKDDDKESKDKILLKCLAKVLAAIPAIQEKMNEVTIIQIKEKK